jgi:penicillin-binding protein 2
MIRFSRKKRSSAGSLEILPEDIFLESENTQRFDVHQFEGRIERPIAKASMYFLGTFFLIVLFAFGWKAWALSVAHGPEYLAVADKNRRAEDIIFSERGIIYDRTGAKLAWNEADPAAPDAPFPLRKYISQSGFGQLLGYVSYPKKDASGNYWEDHFIGKAGAEETYNTALEGIHGARLSETDALGKVQADVEVRKPEAGKDMTLSIDAGVQHALYENIAATASKSGFQGGAGVIMDVQTGEVLALASYPEYDSQIMSDGDDVAAIRSYMASTQKPFLNRVVSGLYTPGSIVKPFVAIGALETGVIAPEKQILSTGSISIPNPYIPGRKTVFKDWKAHGWTDMVHAIAVSSDVYFYAVGGGYGDQRGIGILNIEKYLRLFGISQKTGIDMRGEAEGVIPNPDWKATYFTEDSTWRIGNTYHTAIGQYGTQVTPIQMARAAAGIATGELPVPHIQKDAVASTTPIAVSAEHLAVVRRGMREGALTGTAKGLNLGAVEVAAKTGTAELGATKQAVNSWVIGFFPYQHPRYAFALVMEHGKAGTPTGATYVMRQVMDWMAANAPEYLE